MSVSDPEYSPDPYAHAVRHFDAAEETLDNDSADVSKDAEVIAEALIGIGWALLAIAKRSSL